jgi:hypothetical protein
VSEDSGGGEQGGRGPLHRTLEICVFAPVGAAVSLAEELPDLIEKGRQRVELHLGNARVVGRFVVHKGRRDLAGRIDDILANGVQAAREAEAAEKATPGVPDVPDVSGVPAAPEMPAAPDMRVVPDRAAAPPTPPTPTVPEAPVSHAHPPGGTGAVDPGAVATVQRALADYDTLSASQVVRRLESLGRTELRAVQRYEAAHRNRRTILNRASQLLDSGAAGSSAG